jgi:hypothetical protein
LNSGALFDCGARYLKFTREIILVAEFHQLLRYRCHDYDSDDSDDWSDDGEVEYDSHRDENDLEYRESAQGLSVGEDTN